jgi:hypothetical protein
VQVGVDVLAVDEEGVVGEADEALVEPGLHHMDARAGADVLERDGDEGVLAGRVELAHGQTALVLDVDLGTPALEPGEPPLVRLGRAGPQLLQRLPGLGRRRVDLEDRLDGEVVCHASPSVLG